MNRNWSSRYGVQAGELRTQITFQQPTVSKDAGGAQSSSWANVSTNPTVWARWVNAHGDETVHAESLAAVRRAVVTVRQRTDILTTWRVLKGGEDWKVISVDAVRGENRWIELVVERVIGTV